MRPLPRVTGPTLAVLSHFLDAVEPVWGLSVVKATGYPTGTVYPLLDRLERLGWVTSAWDEAPGKGPRRRLYSLKPEARRPAVALLADRPSTAAPRLRPAGGPA